VLKDGQNKEERKKESKPLSDDGREGLSTGIQYDVYVDEGDGCWLWKGCKYGTGYGETELPGTIAFPTRANQVGNSQYPALDLRRRAFSWRQIGPRNVARLRYVRSASEVAAPQGGIDLGNAGMSFRNDPAVKWPKMDAETKALTDEPQPGKPGMGGFEHRSLHVEMKNRFRAARTFSAVSRRQRAPASRASRERAWENLQQLRSVLKDLTGMELPPMHHAAATFQTGSKVRIVVINKVKPTVVARTDERFVFSKNKGIE
jgi:hypothetical protein